MAASGSKSLQGFGFLTAVEVEELGWIGGYLILNRDSRPLEFHCTAPVKPNRAQQILYGPTLQPYICGEQIGVALTGKSNVQPEAIFTDVAAMVAVRSLVNTPVALVESTDDIAKTAGAAADQTLVRRVDAPHALSRPHSAERLIAFLSHKNGLEVDAAFAGDQQVISSLLDECMSVDLSEPFLRIREAIEETQVRKR